MIRVLPSWSIHHWEAIQANRHGALSFHVFWPRAWWIARRDDDLVIFGPYWPEWQKQMVCRVLGHRPYRSTAVAVRDMDCPPTKWGCSRCDADLGWSWNTYGKTVNYGRDGTTYDGEWHPGSSS